MAGNDLFFASSLDFNQYKSFLREPRESIEQRLQHLKILTIGDLEYHNFTPFKKDIQNVHHIVSQLDFD